MPIAAAMQRSIVIRERGASTGVCRSPGLHRPAAAVDRLRCVEVVVETEYLPFFMPGCSESAVTAIYGDRHVSILSSRRVKPREAPNRSVGTL